MFAANLICTEVSQYGYCVTYYRDGRVYRIYWRRTRPAADRLIRWLTDALDKYADVIILEE